MLNEPILVSKTNRHTDQQPVQYLATLYPNFYVLQQLKLEEHVGDDKNRFHKGRYNAKQGVRMKRTKTNKDPKKSNKYWYTSWCHPSIENHSDNTAPHEWATPSANS